MTKWLIILCLLLTASVGLNVYLFMQQVSDHVSHVKAPLQRAAAQNNTQDSAGDWMTAVTTNQAEPTELAVNEKASTATREALLSQASIWLQAGNYLPLSSFLQGYLKQHPQDMDFLLIEAQLKVETTLLSDAITHYYSLLRYPMTAAQQKTIEQQIKRLSHNTIEQLISNYSWDVLAMFTEPLLQLDPSNRSYLLALALAYAEQEQAGLMENVLASLEYDDPDAQRIRLVLNTKRNNNVADLEAESGTTDSQVKPNREIPLQQYGDQFVVTGTLSSNPINLLIDTGASVTAVSRQFFDNLSNSYKINYLGRFSIGTAAGNIMAPIYQFSILNINGLTVENLPVVVLPMQRLSNADGLLGMNFLREFDFKIDQQQSVLLIY